MGHDTSNEMDDKATTKSESRSGEEVSKSEQEPGRYNTGTQGSTDRPVGESNARDYTGVDPKEPITKDDPVG